MFKQQAVSCSSHRPMPRSTGVTCPWCFCSNTPEGCLCSNTPEDHKKARSFAPDAILSQEHTINPARLSPARGFSSATSKGRASPTFEGGTTTGSARNMKPTQDAEAPAAWRDQYCSPMQSAADREHPRKHALGAASARPALSALYCT